MDHQRRQIDDCPSKALKYYQIPCHVYRGSQLPLWKYKKENVYVKYNVCKIR